MPRWKSAHAESRRKAACVQEGFDKPFSGLFAVQKSAVAAPPRPQIEIAPGPGRAHAGLIKTSVAPLKVISIFPFAAALLGASLFPAGPGARAAGANRVLSVDNGLIRATYDPANSIFTLTELSAGRTFLRDGHLLTAGGGAAVVELTDPIWGAARGIEITQASGAVTRLLVYPQLPFVVLQGAIANPGDSTLNLAQVQTMQGALDLGTKAEDLRARGTMGLTGVDAAANPGSYAFLAVADPATRAGVVGGWLTHDRGTGVVFSSLEKDRAILTAKIDYGRLLTAPGATTPLETFLLGWFADARLGLEAYADAVARQYAIHLPPQPTVYCTWYHARASNEKALAETATFAREHLRPFGLGVIQIDDGWQDGSVKPGFKKNGPLRNFNTHRPAGPYAAGMKATADSLTAAGFTPGLWLIPFAGSVEDPFFDDKQELFARKDGQPFVAYWGGTCFDLTVPAARDYVRQMVHRIAHDWGYRYFKLDGLWTGSATSILYVNTGYLVAGGKRQEGDDAGLVDFHDNRVTPVEAYRSGLKLVREAAGPEAFILGCNVAQNMRTLGGSFGLLDAMRIGPDNGRSWSSLTRGPFSGSSVYFLHGRVWLNDPDPLYVTDQGLSPAFARLLCSWVALSGQLNASSEDYAGLSPARLHLLQRTMPAHGLRPRPVDFFEERIPAIWLLTDDRGPVRRDVVGLFNWHDKEATVINRPLANLGLDPTRAYVAFDFWGDRFVAPFRDSLIAVLPAADCQVLAVRPVADHPQLLSTSRHVAQGIVDVIEETWEPSAGVLAGTSRVVGGDPYELRVAAQRPAGVWRSLRAEVAAADAAAGVSITLKPQDGWKVRAEISAPASREVRWRLAFE